MQRSDAVERSERQPLRHRRDACDGAPRLSGWQAAMGAYCSASAAALDRRVVVIATRHQCDVLPAPLRFRGHRYGSLDSIALAAVHGSSVVSERQMLRNISFFSIQAKSRPTHAAWAASMRAESKTRRRRMALSCAHHSWLACCSPERRGPAGTQVTRAVEEWSQRSLSLLVCAGRHLWPPRGARRVVHAPRVRRPSPLKAREAAQG